MPLDNPAAYLQQIPQQILPQLATQGMPQGMPGLGLLQQLLGRPAAQPAAPPPQQIPTSELMDMMNTAQGVGDVDKMRRIRTMIEGRTADDVARGQGPQATGVESAGKTSAEPTKSFNPFKILSDALSGVDNDLSPGR